MLPPHLAIPYVSMGVVAIGLVWLIASQPPVHQTEQTNPQQQRAANGVSQFSSAGNGQPSTDQQAALAQLFNTAKGDPIAWLTFGILVVTGLQTRFNFLLTDHAKTIERAYVVVDPLPPGLGMEQWTETREDGITQRHVELVLQVRNSGHTPARITDVAVAPWLGVSPPDIPPVPKRGNGAHAFLTTGDAVNTRWSWMLDAKAMEDNMLYLFGFVDYIDKFDQRHRLGFARWFNRALDDKRHYMRTPKPAATTEPFNFREHIRRLSGELDSDAYDARRNLENCAQAGYNYDRLRRPGEGADWCDKD